MAEKRLLLLLKLAGYGNRDGGHISPAVKRLARDLGWSRATVHRHLDELKQLGLLHDVGPFRPRCVRERRIDLERARAMLGLDSPAPATPAPVTVELPEWVPAASWQMWVEMRRRMGKPLCTVRQVELAIGQLAKLREKGYQPAQVLDQSTLSGWAGLFPLRGHGWGPSRADQRTVANLRAAGLWDEANEITRRNRQALGLDKR